MKAIRYSLGHFAAAARIGYSDMAAVYTIRTWLFGWFVRLVGQVTFFSLYGLVLGSISLAHYRVIGNGAALVCIEAMPVIFIVVRERGSGTLAMQILSPSPFVLTYVARGVLWLIVGVGSSTSVFVIAALAFRLPLAMPQALLTPLVLAVMGLTSYCFGLAMGAVVMARPSLQWLAVNIGYLSVLTFAGVNVPVSYWPAPVRIFANALPLTHGLRAFRLLLAAGSYSLAVTSLAEEFMVGACWLMVAIAVLTVAVRMGRRNGTLELSPG
jgi:ABC-2 type transport system permease protein